MLREPLCGFDRNSHDRRVLPIVELRAIRVPRRRGTALHGYGDALAGTWKRLGLDFETSRESPPRLTIGSRAQPGLLLDVLRGLRLRAFAFVLEIRHLKCGLKY